MSRNSPAYLIFIISLISLFPFYLLDFGVFNVDMFEASLLLSVVMFSVTMVGSREIAVVPSDRQLVILLMLLSFAFLSGLWARNGLLTVRFAFSLAGYVLFYLLVLMLIRKETDLSKLVRCMPWIVIILMAYTVMTLYQSEIPALRGASQFRFLVRSGLVGIVAVISMISVGYVYLLSRKFVTTLYSLTILGICGASLVFSASRAASAVAILSVTVYCLFLIKEKGVSRRLKGRALKLLIVIVGAGLVAFIAVASLSPKSTRLYTVRMLGTFDRDYGFYQKSYYWKDNPRLQSWDAAYQMTAYSPFLGVGFGNFREYVPQYYPHWTKGNLALFAHNVFLNSFAELGVVGFGLIVALLLSGFINYRAVVRSLRRQHVEGELILAKTLEVIFWGLLIHSAFRPMLRDFSLFLFLALSVCCRRILIPRAIR